MSRSTFSGASQAALRPRRLSDAAVIGFGLTLSVLVVGGALGYLNTHRLADNNRQVAHTHEVIGDLESLLSTLKDAETGQRGYLLAEDEKYLQPYDDAVGRVQPELAHLKELTSDNPDQQAWLAQLDKKVAVRLNELQETVALMKKGDRPGALKIVRTDTGKALMDDLRQAVAAMQQTEHDLLRQRADESEASYRATVASILVCAIVGLVLVVVVFYLNQRNAIQRQRAAAVIAEQAERLRTTLASIGDAVITTDEQGRITNMNAVAESLTGWTNAEALGASLDTVFNIVNESTRKPVENPALRALKEGVIVGLANHTILIHKHGSGRPIDDSAAPIRCKEGEVVGCVLVFRDITERKKGEEALRRLAADLSEADRRKDEFLATLAHELRNPLAPIRNALQILRLTGGNGQAVQPATEMMERQMGQMVRLIDDLLDVSRISRGKIELKKERVELASIIHHSVEAMHSLMQCKEHELTVTLPPQPIYLNADPTRLAQVLENLLNNGCKFTGNSGRIWLTVEQEGAQAVIRVRDTGIGIAAEDLPRIFDMFIQADTSLERQHSGLGIGLTLVKNLVEMHGGSVEVHSAGIDQGSEFVVRLPIMAETPKPPPEPAVYEATPARAGRILVVDDNLDSAESLAMLLRLTGNETHMAHDGEEAVEVAIKNMPDVILLDIGLPKLNGYEACRRIREQPCGKNMVIIALTGWGQEEDRRKSSEAGFNGHLVKPVAHDALMKLLTELQPTKV